MIITTVTYSKIDQPGFELILHDLFSRSMHDLFSSSWEDLN